MGGAGRTARGLLRFAAILRILRAGAKGDGMRSETGHVGANLAVWGGLIALVALAMAALPEGLEIRWWVWVGGVAWLSLWVVAILNLSDGASRAFVAGTLRKSTYMQIYTTLTRRNVTGVWRRVCAAADDRDSVPALLRAALTWRLYDAALLIAVAYPIALPVAQWIATGEAARIGSAVLAEPAAFWWERAAVLGAFAVLILGLVGRKLAAASSRDAVRWTADWLLVAAAAVAVAVAAVVGAGVGAVAAVGAVAVGAALGVAVAAVAGVGPGAFAAAIVCAFAVLFVVANAIGIATAVAGAGAGAAVLVILRLDARGRPRAARAGLTGGIAVALVLCAALIDWTAVPDEARSVFLLLGALPLLNALFDTASYAVTLAFLRRGLRARLPLLWGLADLAVACGLFLALGAALVAAMHGLNRLAGVPLLDLGALLSGVRAAPGDYVWLYLMLFSTILPTALHLAVSLLGVQGVWPRAWRRPVADWIGQADRSPLRAVRAALALSLVWWVPLALLGAALWGLWAVGGGAIRAALGLYLEGLLWIAQGPVGAL